MINICSMMRSLIVTLALSLNTLSYFVVSDERTHVSSGVNPPDKGCNIGCETNEDCNYPLICYERQAGMELPGCCTGADYDYTKDLPGNFCVSAACASYTDDPLNPNPLADVNDDYFNGGPFPKIQLCQSGCEYPYQCAEGLTCLVRSEGDPQPVCCEETDPRDSKDETATVMRPASSSSAFDQNFCVPHSCTSTTPAPTPAPGLENAVPQDLCFSGETTVIAKGRGEVLMNELRVGDLVLTRNSRDKYRFLPVYAFAHLHDTRKTTFLQIYTNSTQSTKPLELTPDHLLFTKEQGIVRADSIEVGDILQGPSDNPAAVLSIDQVVRRGLYAPLTRDGTIVVGGVFSSNYIALQKQSKQLTVKLADPVGTLPFLNQADLVHWWLSPLRLVCPNIAPSIVCNPQTSDGKLLYVDWGLRLVHLMETRSIVFQLLVLGVVLAFLAVPLALEKLFATIAGVSWEVALFTLILLAMPCLRVGHKRKAKMT